MSLPFDSDPASAAFPPVRRARILYLLVCRECGDLDDDPLVMPFDSAEARGSWAAAHTRGTGHDRWYVEDEER